MGGTALGPDGGSLMVWGRAEFPTGTAFNKSNQSGDPIISRGWATDFLSFELELTVESLDSEQEVPWLG
jgi:hypothetical protein